MLAAVSRELRELGHHVTILCAKGGYASGKPPRSDEDAEHPATDGISIRRGGATSFGRRSHLGKLADYLSFYLTVARGLAVMDPKPDRVVALTTPPFLSILARLFSRLRGGDHAHWVMDLYPDVMIAHGMLRSGGLVDRLLGALAKWGFGGSRCKVVVTLGPDMAERVASYLHDTTKIEWIPLWGTAEGSSDDTRPHFHPDPSPPRDPARPLVLMYSGNMGLGHRFGEFLHAAAALGPEYVWKFHGNGKRRGDIEQFIEGNPEAPIELGDYVPRSELASHLASADVHLASLAPCWDGTMVPSKLQGIFAIGKPVIFVGTETCSIGQWVAQSGGGWVVNPDDHNALALALRQASDPGVRERKGRAARQFAATFFDARINAARVACLLGAR